jgi:hypothetical protein
MAEFAELVVVDLSLHGHVVRRLVFLALQSSFVTRFPMIPMLRSYH